MIQHAGGNVKLLDPMYIKQTNKDAVIKSLAILKCKSRTSLHTLQYK